MDGPGDITGLPLTALDDAVEKLEILLKTGLRTVPLAGRAEIEAHLRSIRHHAQDHLTSRSSPDIAGIIARDTVAPTPESCSAQVTVLYIVILVKRVMSISSTMSNGLSLRSTAHSCRKAIWTVTSRMISLHRIVRFPSPGIYPTPGLADEYIDTYFSTIHIAYPFVPRSSFLRIYTKARDSGLATEVGTSWLAILCTFLTSRGATFDPCHDPLIAADGVFALGAYYRSFPGNTDRRDAQHEKLFKRALLFSRACEGRAILEPSDPALDTVLLFSGYIEN